MIAARTVGGAGPVGAAQAWRSIRRRWVGFVAIVLVCLLAGAAVSARTQKAYSAKAELFVSVALPNDPAALAATNTFVTARVQSYVSLVTTPSVTDPVVQQLKLPYSSRALAGKLAADAPLNKVLIDITATDATATRATDVANAVAQRFVAVVSDLERTASTAASPVRVTVIQPAVKPSAPVRPRTKLNLALALLAGLLVAFTYVRVRGSSDEAHGSARHQRRVGDGEEGRRG